MMAAWQVQQAKTRLSEVIERARTEGPQTITRHGAERAVVLSIEDYRALVAHKPDFKGICSAVPRSTILRSTAIGIPAAMSSFERAGGLSPGEGPRQALISPRHVPRSRHHHWCDEARSFLRHPGFAQTGEISGFVQGADLRHPPEFDGLQ